MTSLTAVAFASLCLAFAADAAMAATPLPEAECVKWWDRADKNASGQLEGYESTEFLARFEEINIRPADAPAISKSEFMAECMKGSFEGLR